MVDVVVSREADVDLLEIWNYIADDNMAAADTVIADLFSRFEHIASYPMHGSVRDDIRPNTRASIVGHFLIFYEIVGAEAHILRVIHGSRDLSAIFR